MAEIVVQLTERELQQLRERAARLGLSVEALTRATVLALLVLPAGESEFDRAVQYVVRKNEALYKRLAAL
ncbi:MAG: DNA-binding protein [Chloroflexi bacterium]|nr:DNA-binding protein [Chloroflexota bacterium]